MGDQSPEDHALAALAARQYGVVGRAQLTLTPRQIERRLQTGRLHAVHRGVYAVGHAGLTREGRWIAAVLACGPDAVLSHRSAATLWRIRDGEGPRPDVTTGAHRRTAGVATHAAPLAASDRATRLGIPVTSPARTLIDLGHLLTPAELDCIVREIQHRRLFGVKELRDALVRRPHAGLRRYLEDVAGTQTGFEAIVLRICDRYRIPRPKTQFGVLGKLADFAWPTERLVVEADSWDGHGTRWAFQEDRRWSNALLLAGWRVLRFTWADVNRRPKQVATHIRQALSGS